MTQRIGQLLRTSRSNAGLALEALAEEAHVSAEALQAFEQGSGSISAAALERVAYVLSVDPIALREGRLEAQPTASVYFRRGAFPDFKYDEDWSKVADALERARALKEVNAILGRPPSLRASFVPELPTPEAAKDGYRLASLVRAEFGDRTGPLPDLTTLLEDRFDILVTNQDLATSRVDALTVIDHQAQAVAVILNGTSERRSNMYASRVDLAHELAHVLFDLPNGRFTLVIDEAISDDHPGTEHRATPNAERRAGAFAAELLMPREGLRELLGVPRYEMSSPRALELVDLARRAFKTPIEIAVNHLFNREYILNSYEFREGLIKQARQADPARGSVSPAPLPTSGRDVLDRRVIEALSQDLITRERARQFLGLSPWDEFPAEAALDEP